MPADCAATLASRRVELACLPLWKLNHEFQWLAIDTDMDGAAMVRRSTNSDAGFVLDTAASLCFDQFRGVEIV
mgnify:CR=1 FL=1